MIYVLRTAYFELYPIPTKRIHSEGSPAYIYSCTFGLIQKYQKIKAFRSKPKIDAENLNSKNSPLTFSTLNNGQLLFGSLLYRWFSSDSLEFLTVYHIYFLTAYPLRPLPGLL